MSKSKFSLSSHHPHFSSERIRVDVEKNRHRIKELGPGIITGAAVVIIEFLYRSLSKRGFKKLHNTGKE